jgi:hypothetical protein
MLECDYGVMAFCSLLHSPQIEEETKVQRDLANPQIREVAEMGPNAVHVALFLPHNDASQEEEHSENQKELER